MAREFKTGITLSGGASRGFTHLGVLKALNEEGIYPEVISGVSGGAILGALYADGHDPEDILEYFEQERIIQNLQLTFPKKGFLTTDKLFKVLGNYIKARTFEELKLPLYVTATNFNTGLQEVFSKGDLFRGLKASSSIPILFRPLEEDGVIYVDGGLVSNLPVEPIRGICDHLIGVNVNPIGEMNEYPNMWSMLERTLHLSIWANVEKNIDQCDLYIEPEGLRQYNIFNLSKVNEIYSIGYRFTKKILQQTTKEKLIDEDRNELKDG